MAILTNEWTLVSEHMPPKWREVLVAFHGGGRKATLVWDGERWRDPVTKIWQHYGREESPKMWYMFEKCPDDYGKRY